jgi:hypothetical protein
MKTEEEIQLSDERGGRGSRSKPDDGEKTWFSINHSVLSAKTLLDERMWGDCLRLG